MWSPGWGLAAAADPFATALQVGTLLTVLAHAPSPQDRTDAGGDFALNLALLRYFSAAAPACEERIEVQKAHLFKGQSRPAAPRSSARSLAPSVRSDGRGAAGPGASASPAAEPATALPTEGLEISSSVPRLVHRPLLLLLLLF